MAIIILIIIIIIITIVIPIIIITITKEMITRTLALVQAEEETVNTSGILFLLVISAAKVNIIIIRIHNQTIIINSKIITFTIDIIAVILQLSLLSL